MNQLSTSKKYDKFCDEMKSENLQMIELPSKRTIDFILQFSKTYHVEKKLPSNLSGLVLN